MADHYTKEAENSASEVPASGPRDSSFNNVKVDGDLEFIHEFGGNGSKPSYQEASGAPVESVSPLGLQVSGFTTVFLNIGQMIVSNISRLSFRDWPKLALFVRPRETC